MWEKEYEIAAHAAREAGSILLGFLGKIDEIVKKGEIDLVTEADLRAEEVIVEIIGRSFPEDNILAEETGDHGLSSDRVWLIDPLDGTTNFAHTFPFFAVSIALEVRKEVVLGIVYNPVLNETFEALKGRGALLNGRPIHVSKTRSLGESLLATGFPYTIHARPHEVLRRFEKMILAAQGVRRPGSAAIDLCYVAAGRLDGFWEEGLNPWDTAAGMVILKEAGGTLGTYGGAPYTPYEKDLIASNPFIFQEMLKVFEDGEEG
jgi:myo-inositol-1(or 4)-monophosphatase